MAEVKLIDRHAGAMSLRSWLFGLGLGSVAAGLGRVRFATAAPETVVPVEVFSADGRDQGTQPLPKVVRADDDWRGRLSTEEFDVTRRAGTERPYTGRTWNQHASGLYRCVCCDSALFDSAAKFESGTGWPSFWQPIAAKNVVEHRDRSFGFLRTEITCVRCDAHLGHVFDDGPKPTGLRYCMNSTAMRFVLHAEA